MIELIFGRSGSGKTSYMIEKICESVKSGTEVIYLAPETKLVFFESSIAKKIVSEKIESFSFTSLCDDIFRKYGGVCRKYPRSSVDSILMYKAIKENHKDFLYYTASSYSYDTRLSRKLLSLRSKIVGNNHDENTLMDASNSFKAIDEKLSYKLHDLSIIFREYKNKLISAYNDRDLTIKEAYERVKGTSYFNSKDVYIDSFDFFDSNQYDIIFEILNRANNVYISFAFDKRTDDNITFELINSTYRKVEKIIKGLGINPIETYLTTPKRYNSKEIAHINLNMYKGLSVDFDSRVIDKETKKIKHFKDKNEKLNLDRVVEKETRPISKEIRDNFSSAVFPYVNINKNITLSDIKKGLKKKKQDVRVYGLQTKMEEAEFIANDIKYKVEHENKRFKDFLIIMRDKEEYNGIVDYILEKYNIPFYLNREDSINRLSAIRYIFTILDICRYDFRLDDVISYLSTSYMYEEGEKNRIDLLKNYIIRWNVPSYLLDTFEGFEMNPRGYVEQWSDSDIEMLKEINIIKDEFLNPLVSLRNEFLKQKTVKEHATTLYNFLNSINLIKKVSKFANEMEQVVNLTLVNETQESPIIICDMLDDLVLSAGNDIVEINGFYTELKIVANETKLENIPTSVDEVIITSASKMDFESAPNVYIVGAYEDGFPRAVSRSGGFFSEKEKGILLQNDFDFEATIIEKLELEYYYFYYSICSAVDTLTFTYPKNGGFVLSSHVNDILTLLRLDEKNTIFLDLPLSIKIKKQYAKGDILDSSYALHNKDLANVLKNSINEDSLLKEYDPNKKYEIDEFKLESPEYSIDNELDENLKKIYTGVDKYTKTSFSRIDKYISCPFSYFCKYVLGLDDSPETIEFGSNMVGTYVHYILENTIHYVMGDESIKADGTIDIIEDETKIKSKINELCRNFEESLFNNTKINVPKKISGLFDYLNSISFDYTKDVISESKKNNFFPCDYELNIKVVTDKEYSKKYVSPLQIIDDTGLILFDGKIDRVDIKKEDGKSYIRIVDYKTGSKEFNLEETEDHGLNMQMPIYLFSIEENGNNVYGDDIIPSGLIYSMVSPKKFDGTNEKDDEKGFIFEGNNKVAKIISSGLYIGDINPPEEETKGKKKPAISAIDNTKYSELKDSVINHVKSAISGIRNGDFKCKPLKVKGHDSPCKYCNYKPICKKYKNNDQDEE